MDSAEFQSIFHNQINTLYDQFESYSCSYRNAACNHFHGLNGKIELKNPSLQLEAYKIKCNDMFLMKCKLIVLSPKERST
jgi:hypothetical protein